MRKMMVMGNWKMNGTRQSLSTLLSGLQGEVSQQIEMAVFPAYPYLTWVTETLADTSIAVGAQDVSRHEPGAFTGEVAAEMLADMQCRYVLVGHSERRQYHAETSLQVAEKLAAVLAQNMTPVLCVGETLAERESGQTEAVIAEQVNAVVQHLNDPQAMQRIVIAYEPVWAIGTGKTATPEQAQAVHAFIRQLVASHCSADTAQSMRILYGGSVKPDNAADLFALADVDGGLVGGASLKPEDFLAIASSAVTVQV